MYDLSGTVKEGGEGMKERNLSKMISWMSVFLAAMVVVNLAVTVVTFTRVNRHTRKQQEDLFYEDLAEMNERLSMVNLMMLSELASDEDLDLLLDESDKWNLSLSNYRTIKRVNLLLANWTKSFSFRMGFYLYYEDSGIEMSSCVSNPEYEMAKRIHPQLVSYLEEENYKIGWQLAELAEVRHLVNIVQKNSVVMICYIDLNSLFAYLAKPAYGEDFRFRIWENGGALPGAWSPGVSGGSLVVCGTLLNRLDIGLRIDDYNRQSEGFVLSIIMGGMMIVVIFMVIGFLLLVNRSILRPILRFNENLEGIKNDEIYDEATHYQMKELENASAIMRELVGRIKNLRIAIYEKTLEQQKTRMEFLSLQIQPHFYLNCLNILFSMAQMHRYQEIQSLISCISVYLRYVFHNADEMVRVQDELTHIEKYLEIQKIRYQEGFSYRIEVDPAVMEARMPCLVLQTFVENALKHTVDWEREILLSITGKMDAQGVSLCVEDTGGGFDEETLRRLNRGEDICEDGHRIGIMNARSRIQMCFGDCGAIWFGNRCGGGARVVIRFPFVAHTETGPEPAGQIFEERAE